MEYARLVSTANLELAWRRITTGRNHQHKRIFRPIYLAYELGHHDNLRRLHERLEGSWKPTSPIRIFLPQPSGLQRPLTLLELEDQIVFQAVANMFAAKLGQRRRLVEGRTVFSNLLELTPNAKFFIQDWHKTYWAFQQTCREHFRKGYRWIASFDLAAFYDTISHELLLKTVAPRDGHSFTSNKIREWLHCWSCPTGADPFHHGIPQGPLASDFLAEAFLLPLDEELTKDGVRYVRYADDIRLFAKTKVDVQRAAIRLEVFCKNLGLIPQGKKFTILEASTINEVLGNLPSFAPPDASEKARPGELTAEHAESLLRESISGRPRRITDKTKLRFVLYRAPRSQRLLGIVLRLLPRYPEHIDAFAAYLSIYDKGRAIERTLRAHLQVTPYDYVRGECWRLLSSIATKETARRLHHLAQQDLGTKRQSFWVKLGALMFLMRCETLGVASCLGRLRHQPAYVQALVVPHLPIHAYDKASTIAGLLRSSKFEPSMMLGSPLVALKRTHLYYGVRGRELAPETQNAFRALRLLKRRTNATVDPLGELLAARIGVAKAFSWRTALAQEYDHCLQLVIQADASFDAGRSHWLQLQNSFNDALARRLIALLDASGLPGVTKLVAANGHLVKFGSLVQQGGPFDSAYPSIAAPFRRANDRRNHLPASHPYDEKKGVRTRHLSAPEQRALVRDLKGAYSAVLALLDVLA